MSEWQVKRVIVAYAVAFFLIALLVVFLTGCTAIKFPVVMDDNGKVAYATYRYAFYDKQAEFLLKPDGTIEFRKKDTSKGQEVMEAAIQAAVKAALAGSGK